jgi:hypothetical protein
MSSQQESCFASVHGSRRTASARGFGSWPGCSHPAVVGLRWQGVFLIRCAPPPLARREDEEPASVQVVGRIPITCSATVAWHTMRQARDECGIHLLDPRPYLCPDGKCMGSQTASALFRLPPHERIRQPLPRADVPTCVRTDVSACKIDDRTASFGRPYFIRTGRFRFADHYR